MSERLIEDQRVREDAPTSSRQHHCSTEHRNPFRRRHLEEGLQGSKGETYYFLHAFSKGRLWKCSRRVPTWGVIEGIRGEGCGEAGKVTLRVMAE